MLILAIDTSTAAASVAVMDENKLYGEMFTNLKLKHSEMLMPITDALLERLRMKISDIDAFAVGGGPGSFTGLRIASAAIKGFAQPKNKPIVAISSIEACAYPQAVCEGEIIMPIFDAQQNSFYTASFTRKASSIERLSEDRVEKIDEFVEKIKQLNGKVLLCGDGVVAHKGDLENLLGDKCNFAPSSMMFPKASAVAELALEALKKGEMDNYSTVLPNYIRASQAEVNYKVKVK